MQIIFHIILFSSSFLFNTSKCELIPTRIITNLGVTIDLVRETFNLTKKFVAKVAAEMIKVKKYRITTRYKQRLAVLLNFATPILHLPFQMIQLAFHHHMKLYKFVSFTIYTDATPSQIGILSHYNKKIAIFKCEMPILEAEYAAIWIAYAHTFTDNMACMHLFRKGRFPPSWRSNYSSLIILFIVRCIK